jgi:hypothetical protein
MIKIFCIVLVLVPTTIFGIYVQDGMKNVTKRHRSPAEWTEPEDGIWSSLLEEYALSNK